MTRLPPTHNDRDFPDMRAFGLLILAAWVIIILIIAAILWS